MIALKQKEPSRVITLTNTTDIIRSFNAELIKVNDLMFYEKEVNGLIVINTFQVPNERIDVKVNKVWVDNDIQEARRPESVVLVLSKKVDANLEEVARLIACGKPVPTTTIGKPCWLILCSAVIKAENSFLFKSCISSNNWIFLALGS